MEKKTVTMNLAELWDISTRLCILHDTMSFISDAVDMGHYGNIAMHITDALGRITSDFTTLLDATTVPVTTPLDATTVPVSDEAVQYLWNRMRKTGKTQFTRTEIQKLTTNSRLLPTMKKTVEALNALKAQGKIDETRISPNNHSKALYVMKE